MKMLTQSEGPVALVSCWLGDHLFASHTVCSHTLMFSAPLVGRLGTCRELSHHWCTCHLNGQQGKGLSYLWWKKQYAAKSAISDIFSVELTSIVLVFDINVGIGKHPKNTRQTYRKRNNNMSQAIQNVWDNWQLGYSRLRIYPWTSLMSLHQQCTGTLCRWSCWMHTCSSWLPPCCQCNRTSSLESYAQNSSINKKKIMRAQPVTSG